MSTAGNGWLSLVVALVVTTLIVAIKVGSLSISFGVAVAVLCLSALAVALIEDVVRLVLKKDVTPRSLFALSIVAWACTSSVALAICSLMQEQS